ncbi:SoxR reducing system RseC family protein [uncultured Bacteroides sp.]|uniref:SoxR reducing system RseC family protein n=1 Tax=uncultured Bacteroides sp. TaxID=162156 RepID=UPI002AA73F50|nr:SoxR reducing system RseC family protein [uncultured Bacteroides sp.]
MTNTIKHQGIVENITGSLAFVRIIQTTACTACSAKGYCSSSESKEKIIEVLIPTNLFLKVGDAVLITGETSMGMMAVLWAFVLPFLLLIISLFSMMSLTDGNELLSSSLSLAILVPYYFILWINKERMKKNFSFTIKPIK